AFFLKRSQEEAEPEKRELKIAIVGDGGCGKTSLLTVYAKGNFPEKYAPSVFEKFVTTVDLEGKQIELTLNDTAGQEDYDRLRPLSYHGVSLVLVCFDVTNPNSYDNVLDKWFPEVKHFCQDVPVILIGCKTDLRKDRECMRKLKAAGMAPISYTQQMNAVLYLECSAKFQENVNYLFRVATKKALAFNRKQKKLKRKKKCVIF
uniref:Ras homolog family member F n=1 Tax=Oryzias sinensis TaxID=183150 RepID=A0A8C7X456_9TELE